MYRDEKPYLKNTVWLHNGNNYFFVKDDGDISIKENNLTDSLGSYERTSNTLIFYDVEEIERRGFIRKPNIPFAFMRNP